VHAGILITKAKGGEGEYSFNPTTVVLLTEAAKLIVSLVLYIYSYVLCDWLAARFSL
jgi:hypothetical protein